MRTRKQLKEDHKDAFDRGYVLVWFSFLLLEMEPKTSCMLDKGLSICHPSLSWRVFCFTPGVGSF